MVMMMMMMMMMMTVYDMRKSLTDGAMFQLWFKSEENIGH
jgi:hypothetical protein